MEMDLSMNQSKTILCPDTYVPMSDFAYLFLYALATSVPEPEEEGLGLSVLRREGCDLC